MGHSNSKVAAWVTATASNSKVAAWVTAALVNAAWVTVTARWFHGPTVWPRRL